MLKTRRSGSDPGSHDFVYQLRRFPFPSFNTPSYTAASGVSQHWSPQQRPLRSSRCCAPFKTGNRGTSWTGVCINPDASLPVNPLQSVAQEALLVQTGFPLSEAHRDDADAVCFWHDAATTGTAEISLKANGLACELPDDEGSWRSKRSKQMDDFDSEDTSGLASSASLRSPYPLLPPTAPALKTLLQRQTPLLNGIDSFAEELLHSPLKEYPLRLQWHMQLAPCACPIVMQHEMYAFGPRRPPFGLKHKPTSSFHPTDMLSGTLDALLEAGLQDCSQLSAPLTGLLKTGGCITLLGTHPLLPSPVVPSCVPNVFVFDDRVILDRNATTVCI
ncbi:hypothetical protein GALMADRAFT_143267 [Galerina marginata CBS 339.88]|uniref:Uncharacterized protein n=1 Tax=Galerina marginata (strain CBS 339.88) TaxID=685588 RepID=A0A067SXQ2_GALM3|nr:hypothetical protein GALMADRAFT_143267 [Galerina marginata CBS 339.88]